MSHKKSLDPRAVRSRRWLQEALLELIAAKPYADISVAEISDRAGLARPTFYLHYGSKEDLLLSYLDSVFEQFYAEIAGMPFAEESSHTMSTIIFKQVAEHAALIQLILQAGNGSRLHQRFQQYIMRVFSNWLQTAESQRRSRPALELTAHYLAGASLSLITYWLTAENGYSAEVMGRVYRELTEPGLERVLFQGRLDDLV